jgi:hypothetical protein
LKACASARVAAFWSFRPLLPDARVCPEAVNGHRGNNDDLRGNSRLFLVARRTTLEILRHLDVITARPAPFTEHFIKSVV